MFRRLKYQTKVFDALQYYLDKLIEAKKNADDIEEVAREKPNLKFPIPNFPKEAFEKLRDERRLPWSHANTPFSSRKDGRGNYVPNITLKVPTGGGKTWLAVKSASMILNKYLRRNTGFILWIVPSEAIYSQTLKNLHNRTHAYRRALDMAAANKVKILTKTDKLDEVDVRENLCVMVLMLQSSNRQNKATLKMFHDRGDVHGFFPDASNQKTHQTLVEKIPNLDHYGGGLDTVIKASLGNALRIIRPIIVVDEVHRAVSDLAHETLYGFNPSFVLELTATPNKGKRPYNILVEITGQELNAEGMIKMPLNVDARQGEDWKAVLNAAVNRLDALQKQAITYQAESDRYIRPILLVQVERTGEGQRGSGYIHADDVKDWLMRMRFDEAEIAIKTAEQNDLARPENKDLLSHTNRIRVIITKNALQEGWDCPFAYVLCSLAPQASLLAMTQLVGRILRQPHATKTGIDPLDQCYVLAHRQQTGEILKKVKKGLEGNGLGDLTIQDTDDNISFKSGISNTVFRREKFKNTQIFLPRVLVARDGDICRLDYHTDILSRTDWTVFDHKPVVDSIHKKPKRSMHRAFTLDIGDGDETLTSYERKLRQHEFSRFDPLRATAQISDIVLNSFVGREIVGTVLDALKAKGLDKDDLGFQFSDIVEVLRKELQKHQDEQAESYFRQAVKKGQIQFHLRAGGKNWEMPPSFSTNEDLRASKLEDEDGKPVQYSLFEPIFRDEFDNQDEREVALYLDQQKTLDWWFRNVAKREYFAIQGWQKDLIYPDFIFSLTDDGKVKKLVALEVKGDHLKGNDDTVYKQEVMQFLTENFSLGDTQPVGKCTLESNGETFICDLVFLNGWETQLDNKYFAQN